MSLSEFDLIQRYFTRPTRRSDVLLSVGDDAALLQATAGAELALSVDMLLAGRHFPEHTAPQAIGHKALAVNLSDMAAMGAEPAWFTLALSLPEADEVFVQGFAEGLFALADTYQVELVGGDTVRGPLAISVQIQGQIPAGLALRRSGASPGDAIFVTGTLGDAGAGLACVQGRLTPTAEVAQALRQRLDYPEPRVSMGMALRGIASAAIDISDGLVADLGHILEASGCGAELLLNDLPLSPALCEALPESSQRWAMAMHAGDDYELCFTVPPERLQALYLAALQCGVPVRCIGMITSQTGITLRDGQGQVHPAELTGFDHFTE